MAPHGTPRDFNLAKDAFEKDRYTKTGKFDSKSIINRNHDDYTWVYEDQPHTDRRIYISKKYPCVKELFGCDLHFRHVVAAEVAAQVLACYLLQDSSWPLIVFLAYVFGGVINHSLVLAIHDIGHNTAYGNSRPGANRWFSMFANLPVGIPSAVTFKKYHIDHHRYLGGITSTGVLLDTDTPTPLEGRLFRGTFFKAIWLLINPLFYAFRPILTSPKSITKYEIYNMFTAVGFDLIIYYLYGTKSVFYLLIGTLITLGIHPTAGHFLAEHYNFIKNSETFSYYGSLNKILFNVGYHNEHHDFPFIPGSRLPNLKNMVPEFYKDLPFIMSWCRVIYDYIFDPLIGPFSRIHRIYDMKTGEILGIKNDRLRKAIDDNNEYTKKDDRVITSINSIRTDVLRHFHNSRKNGEYEHIPTCVKFNKYFEG